MRYGVIRVIINGCKKSPGLSKELCCIPVVLKSSGTYVIIATILSMFYFTIKYSIEDEAVRKKSL